MNINVLESAMTFDKSEGYVGRVVFEVEGHQAPYELTLQKSRKATGWAYAFNFLSEPGKDEEIEAVEEMIEEDDDFFDRLVDEAKSKLKE